MFISVYICILTIKSRCIYLHYTYLYYNTVEGVTNRNIFICSRAKHFMGIICNIFCNTYTFSKTSF